MRVYSVIDYRYYPMLNNFVYLYPEVKKNQYQNVKIDYYFKSFLNDLAGNIECYQIKQTYQY